MGLVVSHTDEQSHYCEIPTALLSLRSFKSCSLPPQGDMGISGFALNARITITVISTGGTHAI